MNDAIYTSCPANGTAARVVSRGVHYEPEFKKIRYETKLPMPTKETPKVATDLVGRRFGRFVVVGFSAEKKRGG